MPSQKVIESTQAVFSAALAAMRKQGQPSVGIDKYGKLKCRYNGSEGKHCAFAPAIQHFDPDIEGLSAGELLAHKSHLLYPWARACDAEIGQSIQDAHDESCKSANFLKDFENRMKYITEENCWLKFE